MSRQREQWISGCLEPTAIGVEATTGNTAKMVTQRGELGQDSTREGQRWLEKSTWALCWSDHRALKEGLQVYIITPDEHVNLNSSSNINVCAGSNGGKPFLGKSIL